MANLSFKDFIAADLTGASDGTPHPDYDPDGYLAWLYQKRHRDITGGPAESTEGDVLPELNEALNAAQRMKRRILFKRIAPKIKLGKERAARRKANQGVLQKRAIALARGLMAKKLLAGKSKGDVTFAERARIEKIIAKRGAVIKRIAAKLLPFLRKKESSKFSSGSTAPAASSGVTQ